ncbi:MAG TPA: DUF3592 domain-containing protein [Povalibacter sp.]|nr:DUF3592 domain-containing protein [Povalibacter sp.]
MPIELPSLIAFCGGVLLAMILSGKLALRGMLASQQILKHGEMAEGTIVGVWRPPVAGSFPRVYFEFHPQGATQPVRCCHVDRRSLSGEVTSLPAVGARVTVRYLPENPGRAVIARLVSRFTH